MHESGQGAFRESADEDPHGTRAIAMRLTPAGRELLSRPVAPLWPWLVFEGVAIGALAVIGVTMALLITVVGVALHLAWVIGEQMTSRFRIDAEHLTIVSARGAEVRHRWRSVTRFTLGRDAARASIGDGSSATTFEARAVRRGEQAWLALDQAVGDADLMIERGSHRPLLTCLWFVAVTVIAALAGWITLGWAFAASTLALIVVNLAIRAPDVVLSRDGIDTGFGVLPWSRITRATRRNRFVGQTLHVQLDDGSERSFVVPERARADALAAELLRRKAAAEADAMRKETAGPLG